MKISQSTLANLSESNIKVLLPTETIFIKGGTYCAPRGHGKSNKSNKGRGKSNKGRGKSNKGHGKSNKGGGYGGGRGYCKY
jgi:hypothetical protein